MQEQDVYPRNWFSFLFIVFYESTFIARQFVRMRNLYLGRVSGLDYRACYYRLTKRTMILQ